MNQKLTLGLACSVVGFGIGYFIKSKDQGVVVMAPSPDNKAEQAYMRNVVSQNLMTSDKRVKYSQCYKDFLARAPSQAGVAASTEPANQGKVVYVLQLAEDGKMLGFELATSDFAEKVFLNCLENLIEGTRFLPPPLGVNRYMSYEFSFKDDEVYKKELEERKNKPALDLVVPTPVPTATP
jgi:hypothetical protein